MNCKAIEYMLTFGYMIDNSTFACEIQRLLPGELISYMDGQIDIDAYYRLDNSPTIECSIDEAVEMIDECFRKAVSRCFDKDIEYNYSYHLADMSAGLDSRMVSWVAKDLGYKNITNISYSQSTSDERIIASEVARFLGNDFLHQQLDDANFIYDVEEIVKMNSGAAYYVGITGGNRLLSRINFNRYGLEHTGQLGDVVVGTFAKTKEHKPVAINSKRNSLTLQIDYDDTAMKEKFNNNEQYNIYTRGFLGALSSHLIRKNYTYAVSPFIDVDFMNLCFSLPLEYRINHTLYFKWIERKYPLAFSLPSSRKRKKNMPVVLKISYRNLISALHFCQNKLIDSGIIAQKVSSNHMNPFEFWYQTNNEIMKFIDEYYEESICKMNVNNKNVRQNRKVV